MTLSLVWGTGASAHTAMRLWMGLTFCSFAMLKLFNPAQFAEGFARYDLLAQRSTVYALAYPFIELALGLAYLSGVAPQGVLWLTVLLMLLGVIGVMRALKAGLSVSCACMGTVLNVPLSSVTLSENLTMGLMALAMLIWPA
ncbi:MAG: MauE/DoxX family redox-associated membrane protein [Vampirovibrionales bacterium]|nr:MauE/DoxX family redox-associated membrane protein [Vampirovibrionales bacterium]